MRKLGEKFSERYRFKRLLATDPEITYKYQQRDLAINSIQPIKEIAIHATQLEKLTPAVKAWPRRVVFAEQIPVLSRNNFSLWIVILSGKFPHFHSTRPTQEHTEVEIIRMDNPTVVNLYPADKYAYRGEAVHPDKLNRIDRNRFASYFLDGKASLEQHMKPLNLNECGILPAGATLLNAAFYDPDVARLYAQSLLAHISGNLQIFK